MTLSGEEQLRLEVELEGYDQGSPQYEVVLRQRRVERCQGMRGISSCEMCIARDSCEVLRHHLRDLYYGVET